MLPLEQLGSRICIIGASSCGKSTLAECLAKKLNMPVYHLDLLAHRPNSNWQRRPEADLIAEHAKIIQQDAWVIEGNYSVCMEERFDRTTAIIWLDMNPLGAVWRYLKRCFKRDPARAGGLSGAQVELRWFMVKQILLIQPKNRSRYGHLIQQYSLPVVRIGNMRDLNCYYKLWGL